MALCCIVPPTITRMSSCALNSLSSTATLMACASSPSAPSSPSNRRNLSAAGTVVFKVCLAREELPGRRLTPALGDGLVGLFEGVFEVAQRDHDAQRHARQSGVTDNSATLHLFSEKVQIRHGRTGAAFARKHLGHTRFDRQPGHTRGQHGQRMAQVDHVIAARKKEIIGGWTSKQHGRTSRKQPLLEIKLGVLRSRDHPRSQCLCRFWEFFRNDYF